MTLLCVANFKANTGYAWDFIESLYARIADHIAGHGIQTVVAYPNIPEPPRTLQGSAARAVSLGTALDSPQWLDCIADVIRQEKVQVVYLTDHPYRNWKYRQLRQAGAQYILVHDHTSGERTRPWFLKRWAKQMLVQVPGITADRMVTVSEYVARRQREISMVPAERVRRVWNGMRVVPADAASRQQAREVLGLASEDVAVFCACRATPEKGVAHLLRAFDRMLSQSSRQNGGPILFYAGAGPQLAELEALHASLASKSRIKLLGYRTDVPLLLAGADIVAVPSVWQDAFPTSVLESLARGMPVVATAVGGIPEMIQNGVTGLLVPPADEAALARALGELLADPARAAKLGAAAQKDVEQRFRPEEQVRVLTALVEEGFGSVCEAVRDQAPR
jgi:glycosyltransferase involved in cell wall biosynthesis